MYTSHHHHHHHYHRHHHYYHHHHHHHHDRHHHHSASELEGKSVVFLDIGISCGSLPFNSFRQQPNTFCSLQTCIQGTGKPIWQTLGKTEVVEVRLLFLSFFIAYYFHSFFFIYSFPSILLYPLFFIHPSSSTLLYPSSLSNYFLLHRLTTFNQPFINLLYSSTKPCIHPVMHPPSHASNQPCIHPSHTPNHPFIRSFIHPPFQSSNL